MSPEAQLRDRARELGQLRGALRAARGGTGVAVVVAGEAGIGKTSLLGSAIEMASELEMTMLSARGGAMERGFAFGVARQLFEPLASDDVLDRALLPARVALGLADAAGDGGAYEARDALYRLTLALAETRPVLLAVDDVHWADTASLQWLLHLARRIADRPVALIVAERTGEPGEHHEVLQSLVSEAGAAVLEPKPLSPSAVAAVVRRQVPTAGEQLCQACADATGGNPFLLVELARELQKRGVPPGGSHEALAAMSPSNVARAVLLRLARLGSDAVALAQAAALLDGEGSLGVAAELAGLGPEAAARAADDLASARILEPGGRSRFVHPLLRGAVYSDIGLARRSAGHRRAAELLDGDRAALHAAATEPSNDAWVAEILHAAGRQAAARGAPAEATRLLARALAEPPPRQRRAQLLLDLGRSQLDAGATEAAADRLREALAFAEGSHARLEAARRLAFALASLGRVDEATAMVQSMLSAVTAADEDRASLAAAFLVIAPLGSDAAGAYADRLRGDAERATGATAGERRLLAAMAYHDATWARGTADAAATMARRALANGALFEDAEPGRPEVILPLTALLAADAADEAEAWLERLRARAAEDGSVRTLASALMFAARLHSARGRLRDAEVDARAALRLARESGALIDPPVAWAVVLSCLVERGEADQAEHELRTAGLDEDAPAASSGWAFLLRRAGVRRALGRLPEAAADARRAVALREGHGLLARTTLAEILWAAGDVEEARQLAATDVAAAERWGAAGAIGMSLRVQALVTGGDQGLELLEHAVAALARSPRQLEHARALVDFGAALRRSQRRVGAREPLEAGMEIAYRCGASTLVARARQELTATGARPRRAVRTGVDALTPSEARVARLAADGLTNRMIAQTLFVTQRTVETHLSSVYRKLDVSSRQALAERLTKDRGAPHDANRRDLVEPATP